MKYPGGKNHGSSYPRIINQIPPHHTYVEPFAGSAAIRRLMKPSARSILIDLDRFALGNLAELVPPDTSLMCDDGLAWLHRQAAGLGDSAGAAGTVIYCDPPYLPSACKSRLRYKYVLTEDQHYELLCLLNKLACNVLISGYWSPLYADLLSNWRTITYEQITRGNTPSTEWLWMNYPEPLALHDYSQLGAGFRERQDVRRQQKRWAAKLAAMTTLRRRALLSVLAGLEPGPLGGNTAGAQQLGPHGRTAEPDRHGIPAESAASCRSINGRATECARVNPDPHTAETPSGDDRLQEPSADSPWSAEPGAGLQRRKRRGSTRASAKTPLLDRPSAPTAGMPSWPATSADMPSAAAIGRVAE